MRTAGNVRLSVVDRKLVKYGFRFEGVRGREVVPNLVILHWREKLLGRVKAPVPQTDTGG